MAKVNVRRLLLIALTLVILEKQAVSANSTIKQSSLQTNLVGGLVDTVKHHNKISTNADDPNIKFRTNSPSASNEYHESTLQIEKWTQYLTPRESKMNGYLVTTPTEKTISANDQPCVRAECAKNGDIIFNDTVSNNRTNTSTPTTEQADGTSELIRVCHSYAR